MGNGTVLKTLCRLESTRQRYLTDALAGESGLVSEVTEEYLAGEDGFPVGNVD